MKRHGVHWAGGLLIAAILALAVYDMAQSYRATVANTGRELDTQARIIAEQTARSLQAVDVLLRHIAGEYRRGRLSRLSRAELNAYLRDAVVGLNQIDGLGMFDAAGDAMAVSWPATRQPPNMASLPRFQALRDDPDSGFAVFEASPGAGDGVWILPLARRLESPGGSFAGVIAARGRVDYFQEFYRDVQLEPGTRTALVHRKGSLVARHPPAPEALGKPLAGAIAQRLLDAAGEGLPLRTLSPIDGADRIGVAKAVPDYPLIVVVTRDADAALAGWQAQALGTAARTLALAALAAALLHLLSRQLSRLQEARASLEATQERFALAVAGADDGIWDYDFVNKRVFASPRAREISAMPPGPDTQAMDEWLAAVPIHPEDAPRRMAAMQAHLDGRAPYYEGEFRMLLPGGGYRWIRIHGLCIRDAAGKPLRMAGSTSDIDVRKRAEEALRKSQERFALAVAGSDDGIWEHDYQTGSVFNSARARELVGMQPGPEELPLQEWVDTLARHLHPEDLPRRQAAMDAHLAGRTPTYEVDVRHRHADGSYHWVRIRGLCVRDADGKPLRMAGSISDIDARQRAEEAIRASEEQYRAIFNASTDALVLRDAEARIVDVNPAFLRISGHSRDEVLHGSQWLFALPETRALAKDMHRRVIGGETVHFEIKAQRKDGTPLDIEMTAVPMLYQGKPHALGLARDVTAQKRAAAERSRLEGQLLQAKKLEAIGTLAGGIAHDFNNILSAILGYGEMAQKGAPAGSPLRRHVDAVVNAGLRAKSLVERILAFSRSGVGERAPVQVQPVVVEALDLAQASLPAHVRLVRKLEAGDAAVMGDPTQIHQVVMNLCANAAQAMKSAGTLTVSLGLRDKNDSLAATSLLAGGRYVRLRVRDTGVGIAQHVQERIFDPFFTTKEVGVGTGLGLSLVHGIVTDLGGGIQVESREGEGTTITVYLPWCDAKGIVAKAEDTVPGGTGETVLLVDDEEALVRLGEEMVAALGYEPVGFTSSAEALAAFRADPARFQAVLSDESMPGMTGSELAREIRRLRPDLPIVLMSGFVSAALAARARELGVAEVLAKPLVSGDIARSLHAALHS